jgi:hypothetical protein
VGNRIFVAVVMFLWLSTMSWLVVAKILPPFLTGDPPGHGILEEKVPVCWQIECGGQHVGYAVRQAVPGAQSTTEIHSRVVLEDIPLRQMAPQWMSSIVDDLGQIRLDTRTRMVLDSLGKLASFDTKVQVNDLPLVVKIYGRIIDANLQLNFISGGMTHEVMYPLPKAALLDGELIPEPKLLQVYVGRKWQTEMFSLFRPPGDALELIQAEVVCEERIMHDGHSVRTRRIEYRSMATSGVTSEKALRATVWVADDGLVLRHDVELINTKLRFERRDDPSMIAKARELLDLDTVATLTTPSARP